MKLEDVFMDMIVNNLDELRTGKLPKVKFLGKYMSRLNEVDKVNAFRFKRPQVVSDGKDPKNNWLDYVLELSDEEYKFFNQALTDDGQK